MTWCLNREEREIHKFLVLFLFELSWEDGSVTRVKLALIKNKNKKSGVKLVS